MPSRFDISPTKQDTRLFIETDEATVARLHEAEDTARLMDALVRNELFQQEIDSVRGLHRYVLSTKRMGKYTDGGKYVVKAFNDMYAYGAPHDNVIPEVIMTADGINGTDRYGMFVALRWPRVDPLKAAVFATQQMQQFAKTMPFYSGRYALMLEELYVRANRKKGIVIQTNGLGSCSIESEHADYTDVPDIELNMHNLYGSDQQLPILVGAVAFANADKHI